MNRRGRGRYNAAMTEAEWPTCADPQPMLRFLDGTAGDRKLRLFVFGCVRRLWHLVPTEPLRHAIETSERHADGLAGRDELGAAIAGAHRARPSRNDVARAAYIAARYLPGQVDWWSVVTHTAHAAAGAAVPDVPPAAHSYFDGEQYVTVDVPMSPPRAARSALRDAEYAAHADLLRDIFGNPFRPASFDPSWLTAGVTSLARTIYDGRAFDRMPELADALERAGCTDADVLGHCRGAGPHVRGCWAVDLILGMQ